MLENIDDYISFIVMILLAFVALRLFSACFSLDEKGNMKKRESIIFDYQNNEDE